MKDESGWVVEFPPNEHGVRYYGRTVNGLGITNEHMDALRFTRKRDAEDVISDNIALWGDTAQAVDHLWCGDEPTDQQRIRALEQERDTLREDVKFSRRAFEIATEQFKKAVRERDTLKARLDAAPHGLGCSYITKTQVCNCWKSRVSGEES